MLTTESTLFKLRSLVEPFLASDELQKLESAAIQLNYQKGEVIMKQGLPSQHIAYLAGGIVKFDFLTSEQRHLILAIVSSPKILGGANIFYRNTNLFSIVAVDDCEVILVDRQSITDIMVRNAAFTFAMLQIASEMYYDSLTNFISLASKHKEGRIADVILYLSEHVYHSTVFNSSLTRKELAEFAGCSTENVIMTLSRWNKENIIRQKSHTLEILDFDKLRLISKIC